MKVIDVGGVAKVTQTVIYVSDAAMSSVSCEGKYRMFERCKISKDKCYMLRSTNEILFISGLGQMIQHSYYEHVLMF